MSAVPLVEVRQIVKDYDQLRANDHIDFTVLPGEVHAVLGENGAGKTTLMNIISGLIRADSGEMLVKGEPIRLRSPRHAIDLGIGMVHQHFKLVDRFTVAENVTLGWHNPRFALRRKTLERRVRDLAIEYGLDLDPAAFVWQLSVGEQQRLEVLKNLYREAEVLILDEPTAVLTPAEASSLLTNLRTMAAARRGVVVITHKLDEVMEVADRVTVLRRGKQVATVPAGEATIEGLAHMMIGGSLPPGIPPPTGTPGDVVLRLRSVDADDVRGLPALRSVDLDLHAGEVLGLAGVAGNGQVELAETIVGLRRTTNGSIQFGDQDITHWSARRRIDAGISFVPEDRDRDGLFADLSITDNLIAKQYRRQPIGGRFTLDGNQASALAEELVETYAVATERVEDPASSLSGGNAQKVMLARELSTDPDVLIAAQLTRGLDIAAAEAARRVVADLRDRDKTVLLISEDLEELLELSDRIAVIYDGRIIGVVTPSEVSEQELGMMMVGRSA